MRPADPAGSGRQPVAAGCVIGGNGGILDRDGYQVPTSGQYTIVVDPQARDTGQVTLAAHT